MNTVSFKDFQKLDIRVGEILSAEPIPETDKLMRLTVDLGEEGVRQIVAGIAEYKSAEELIGTRCAFVANLEERTIRGVKSQGMVLAALSEGTLSLLAVDSDIPAGTRVS